MPPRSLIDVPDSTGWSRLRIGSQRLQYAVSGDGPAVVLLKKDRGVYWPPAVLADRYRIIEVEPIGFGGSDRPDPYPAVSVPEQVLAVCDAEGIEDFAVWGFSQGGAMAWAVAQATPRTRAVVCGGFNPLRPPSKAWIDRMNREQRVASGSRAFWNYFTSFDWHHEIIQLTIPALLYAGTRDNQRPNRHDQQILETLQVETVTFDGLDHAQCGLSTQTSPATDVVADWLEGIVGR